jgi:septal ring factor EnvC (AmiA/AmiB activator)
LKKEEGRLRDTQRSRKPAPRTRCRDPQGHRSELKPKAKPAAKPGAPAKLDLSLTPEAKELNTDFEKNKGKLPWPVEKGVITSRFGKQPHPVLKGIVIENNGIDITTEKNARCVPSSGAK